MQQDRQHQWGGDLFNQFFQHKQQDLNDANIKNMKQLTLSEAQTELRAYNLDFNSTNIVEYIEKYNSMIAKVSTMLRGQVRILFKKQITDVTDQMCRLVGDDTFAQIFYANTYPLLFAIIQYFFCFSQLKIDLMSSNIAKSANQEFQQLCRYIVFRYRELYNYNTSTAFHSFCAYVEDFNKRVTLRINELCSLIFDQNKPEAQKLGQSLDKGGVLNNSSVSIFEYKYIDDMFQWLIRQKKTFDYVMIEFGENVERLGTIPPKDLSTVAEAFVKGEKEFNLFMEPIIKKTNEIRDYFFKRGFYSLGQLDKEQYTRYFLIIFFKNRGFVQNLRNLMIKKRKQEKQDFGGNLLKIKIANLDKIIKYYASQLGEENTTSYQAFYQFLQMRYSIDFQKILDIKLACDPLANIPNQNSIKKGGIVSVDDEVLDDFEEDEEEVTEPVEDDLDYYYGGKKTLNMGLCGDRDLHKSTRGGSMQVAKEAAKAAAMLTGITSLSGAIATGAAIPTALLGSSATATTSAVLAAYMTKGDNVVSRAIENVMNDLSLEGQIDQILHEPTSEYWNILRPCEESEEYQVLQNTIDSVVVFFKDQNMDLLLRVFQKIQFTFLTFLVEDYSLSSMKIFQNKITLGDDTQQINQLSSLFLSLSRGVDRINGGVEYVKAADRQLNFIKQKNIDPMLNVNKQWEVPHSQQQIKNIKKKGGSTVIAPSAQYLQDLISQQDFYQFAFDVITMNGDNLQFFRQDKVSIAQALNDHRQRKTIGLFIRIFQSQNQQMINECLLEYNNAQYYYNILQKYLKPEILSSLAQNARFRHSDIIFSLFVVLMNQNKILSMTILNNTLKDYAQIDSLFRQLCDELDDFVTNQNEWKKNQEGYIDQQQDLQLLSDPALDNAYQVLEKFITISKQYKGFDDKVKAYYDKQYDQNLIKQMNEQMYQGKSKFEFIQNEIRL